MAEQLWGGETAKAIDNFPVSGEPIPAPVARWLGRIKAAAARVNAELGLLDARGLAYVDYEGWQAIDRHEQSLGAPHGRPRTKLATWDELLHHGRRG